MAAFEMALYFNFVVKSCMTDPKLDLHLKSPATTETTSLVVDLFTSMEKSTSINFIIFSHFLYFT